MVVDDVVTRLEAWEDGRLDAAGQAELAASLRNDPALLTEARAAARFNLLLREALRPQSELDDAWRCQRENASATRQLRIGARTRRRLARRHWLKRLMPMAALLAVAVGVVVWSTHPSAAADDHTLRWDDGTVVELASGAQASKADDGPRKQVLLETGSVTARVAPQPAGASFTVLTAEARATAIGTVYRVLRGQTGTTITVEQGHVRVDAGHGRERVLGPGETMSVAPGPLPVAAPAGWQGGAWVQAQGAEPAYLKSLRTSDGPEALATLTVHAAGLNADLVPWREFTAIELDLPLATCEVSVMVLTRRMVAERIGVGAATCTIPATVGSPAPGLPGWRRVRLERSALRPTGGDDVAFDRILLSVPVAQDKSLRLARAAIIR